jgi:hypothetical protein
MTRTLEQRGRDAGAIRQRSSALAAVAKDVVRAAEELRQDALAITREIQQRASATREAEKLPRETSELSSLFNSHRHRAIQGTPMPLTKQTHSGHELTARATIAAALIASKRAEIASLDFSTYWADAARLVDLATTTERIFQTIAEKR